MAPQKRHHSRVFEFDDFLYWRKQSVACGQQRRNKIQNHMQENLPKVGEKITFVSAEGRFYPHFSNIIDFAKRKLIEGREYTVKDVEVHSSWTAVWLSDAGLTDCPFHLSMFDWQGCRD